MPSTPEFVRRTCFFRQCIVQDVMWIIGLSIPHSFTQTLISFFWRRLKTHSALNRYTVSDSFALMTMSLYKCFYLLNYYLLSLWGPEYVRVSYSVRQKTHTKDKVSWWTYFVDGENIDADVVDGVFVQSSDVVTESRRTEDATVLDHVAANSLIADLKAPHLHQAVLQHRPHNLSHSSPICQTQWETVRRSAMAGLTSGHSGHVSRALDFSFWCMGLCGCGRGKFFKQLLIWLARQNWFFYRTKQLR